MNSSNKPVRTRFAPSPTGYLHIGGARTALFSWAFARRHQGTFILRIEDTDLERSTPEATEAILQAMQWLDLQYDEGPFYQTRRMDRYKEVIEQMLLDGRAYRCYASRDELDAMRAAQEAAGLKPRYDGRWRPQVNKELPAPPPGVDPVIRFKNPTDGAVSWVDMVKGEVTVSNAELDDLIIARSDGTPTYNFCVVVDDLDMQITHVIRGDDHVNNTPRQINILLSLVGGRESELPRYGHVPLLHGPDGQKLSKRHGAVSVMQYQEEGYLPEAVCNYLARLGWSHGDDEIFSREQLVQWFDTDSISKGPARLDFEKFKWVNHHYIQKMDIAQLIELVKPLIGQSVRSFPLDSLSDPSLHSCALLLRDRCSTLLELRDWMVRVLLEPSLDTPEAVQHLNMQSQVLLKAFSQQLQGLDAQSEWTKDALSGVIKATLANTQIKMPALAMPARVALFGTAQTPSLDAMLALLTPKEAIARLQRAIDL
jgi:glutamyl-tRNA synthetase